MTLVLTIDDEPTYHQMIAKALEPLNIRVEAAENGMKGLAMARSLKPDAIITDVMMPDISGYELTRTLRREPGFAQTPIMVLTGQAGLQDKLKSFEAGADDHLTKPFEPAELAARLSALLRRAEAAKGPGLEAGHEQARMIALHSLRGGTGSSSLSVNLAVALASLWRTPTILLDLSMMAGQVALMLNASLRRTWADIAPMDPAGLDMETLSSIIGKHESGLAFIAAPTVPSDAETITGETLAAAISLLKRHYDYVIADLPHDFSAAAVQALDSADLILTIAAPEMASIRAIAAATDTYQRLGYSPDKIKLILSATFPKQGLPREKIESALGVPVWGIIPYTPDLFVEAINLGRPLVAEKPGEPISGLLEDLAFHLSRDSQRKSKPENPTEVWKRVYKRHTERKK